MPRKPSRPRSSTAAKRLRERITELEDTLYAIKVGQIDALVIKNQSTEENKVFTLQGAEHPYRILVETMDVGAATLDSIGTILYANARFAEMFAVSLEKFIGSSIFQHVPPEEQKNLTQLVHDGSREPQKGTLALISKTGHRSLLRLALSPVIYAGLHAVCLGAAEVTEIMEANEALQANEQSLRQLSARLLQLQDDERRHIARDLHDVTGQKLAILAISLGQLDRNIGSAATSELKKNTTECLAVAKEVISEIRTLSYLLHPPLLDELGLSSAVHWFTEGFEKRTKIHVNVDVSPDLVRLPMDTEVALFRVIQESLGNVHRHSGSKTATIVIRATPTHVTLEIRDQGKGMRSELQRKPDHSVGKLGVGIQGMRERMRQLGGSLEVSPGQNGGIIITASVPNVNPIRSSPEIPEIPGALQQIPQSPENGVNGVVESSKAYKRILIADDHEVMRRGVFAMLQNSSEWEVCGEAVNGKEVVEKIRSLGVDLVILDINMPELNGLAAIRRIVRADPRTRILMFSVHNSEQTIREIREAGAHGYVSKSNAGQDLVNAVRAVLNGQNFYPELAPTV